MSNDKNPMVPETTPGSEGQTDPIQPSSLGQAFKQINEKNSKAAEEVMGSGEDRSGEDGVIENQAEVPPVNESGGDFDNTDILGGSADDAEGLEGDGGPEALGPEQIDELIQELAGDIESRARAEIIKGYEDEGYQPWDIDMLYRRDEESGIATYINPDNERQPFASRLEAEAYVNSMNNQLKTVIQKDINKRVQELVEEEKPRVQLLQFLPTYNNMPEKTQEVFMDLIENHAVRDSDGAIKGYDTDLPTAYKQAQSIVAKFSSAEPTEQEQAGAPPESPTEPSMDLKSKGSGSSGKPSKEPTSVGEAMRMIREMEETKEDKK